MNFNHKFFCILSAAATASLAVACSLADKKEAAAPSAAAPAPAAAPVTAAPAPVTASNVSPTLTFAKTDAARVGAKASELPDAQKKIDAEFGKKFAPLRDAYRKNNGEAELNAMEGILTDTKASSAARAQVPLTIVDIARNKRDYKTLNATVDKALNGAYGDLPSSVRASLLLTRANAYEQQKLYAEAANDLLRRLSENVDEKDLFNQQRRVVQMYRKATAYPAAATLAKEMLASKKMSDNERARVWYDLLDIARDSKDAALMQDVFGLILKSEKDPKATEYLRNILRTMDQQKLKAEATALRDSIISDTTAPMGARLDAFYVKAEPIKNNERSNKRRIYYLLGNTLFKTYKKNPFLNKPLIADAAAEVKTRQDEDLHWILDAMKEAGMTPAQFADLAGYLKRFPTGGINPDLNKAIMQYPAMPGPSKVGAYGDLINAALDKGDFATANRLADEAAKLDGLVQDSDPYITAVCYKAYVLRIQDRCDEAVAHIRSKMGKKNNRWCWKLIETYGAFGRTDDIIKVRIEFGDKRGALDAMANRWPDKAKAWALQALKDPKENEDFRRYCVERMFFGGSAEAKSIRKTYADLLKKTGAGTYQNAARNAITYGDYELLAEMIAGWKEKAPKFNWERVRMELQLYGVTKNKAKLLEMFRGTADCKEMNEEQKRIVAFCAGTLMLDDKAGDFTKFYQRFPFGKEFPNAKRADVLLKAASLAVNARLDVITQEAYKAWEGLYKPEPTKIYMLDFSDAPILGMEGFLKHAGKSQIQLLDRKFGGNMDFLVTDVSTGNRAENIGTDKGQNRPTEMQAVCDENGIHFLFTAFDDKTKDIEAGTAGAGSYEMYFAPGKGQPYFCFLPDLTNGTNSIWDSAYENAQWHRIDNGKKVQHIKSERIFTPNGYALYMYISWEPFYDKLPEAGDLWDFENVHWSRFGGFSWNGLKTVHGRSTWGHLQFNITPDQMLKIKRKLIYSAKRHYQAEKRTNASIHGVIERWKNDKVLGDPAFFKAYAEPLITKLDGKLGAVKPDMTADEINEIFRDYVPGWYRIRFEMSELRRQYLEDIFTDDVRK